MSRDSKREPHVSHGNHCEDLVFLAVPTGDDPNDEQRRSTHGDAYNDGCPPSTLCSAHLQVDFLLLLGGKERDLAAHYWAMISV